MSSLSMCDFNDTNMTAANNTSNDCNIDLTSIGTKPALFRVGTAIFAYFTPVIFVVGLIGNSLSLAVFTSKSLRTLSASSYLAALSIADISSLLFYVLIEWLRRGLEHIHTKAKLDFLDMTGFCQLFLYMAYLSRLMSSWVIVAFTIERFVGICYPLRSFRRGAKKMLLSMLGVSTLLVLYKPILSGEYIKSGKTVCGSNPDFKILSFALDGVFAVSITLIPFLIISILNTLIARKLFLRNKESKDLFSDDSKIRLEFTVILLAISFFFIAFNLPYSVVWARNYFCHSYSGSTADIENIEYWNGILTITRVIFYMNYCVNFFLYSITGKYFRTALVQMLLCKGTRRNTYGSYVRCNRMGSSMNTNVNMCNPRIESVRRSKEAHM